MYLRVTRRHNKDGSTVEYFQLAHNYRHPETGHSTVRVIHNFGRADQLERALLVRLCESIARVCDLTIFTPEGHLALADGEQQLSRLPGGLRFVESRELGTLHVIEAFWERLGIGPTLRQISKKTRRKIPYERAVFAMTANRLCEPESKLGVWQRWLEQVYLPSCQDLKLAQMYEAMDFLHAHIARVEKAVFFEVADLFNLDVDLIFYDTTTISFSIDHADGEIDADDERLRRRGHSKEGTWRPQVVVALAVTKQGLPVRSWVFPGDTADVSTIERVKADLKEWKLHRAIFVADSGMNSKENRLALSRACGKYLLAMRLSSVAEVKKEVLGRAGRFRKISENLRVKEVVVGDGEARRRYVLCFNPGEAKRQGKHRQAILDFLEQELDQHPSKDPDQRWARELLTSRRYGRYLKIGRGRKLVIDRAAAKEAVRTDGKWVVLTNDDSLSVEDAALGYKNLMVIERCFRTLKRTHIKMGPMYHWLTRRIEAHVKICVLALLIERSVEIGSERPWSQVRTTLRRLEAGKFATSSHHFWQRTELGGEVLRLLQSLGIPRPKQVLAVEDTPSDA